MSTNGFSDKAAFIWQVADLLRGPYHPNQYKDVMLPLTVLRRLDCVLDPTKDLPWSWEAVPNECTHKESISLQSLMQTNESQF
jgi:hypothetical protein